MTEAEPESDPAEPGPSPAAQIGVTDVRRLWPQVLEAVKAQNRRAHALLESAAVTVVRVEGGVLLLSTQFPALARMVSEARNADLVRAALRDILGVDWRIRCVEAGGDGPLPGRSAEPLPDGSRQTMSSGPRTAAEPAAAHRRSSPSGAASRAGRGETGRDRQPSGGQPPRTAPDRGSPPEPDGREDADYDPYSDIDPDAETSGEASYQVHDPSQAAIDLLTAKLGAHPIDDPS